MKLYVLDEDGRGGGNVRPGYWQASQESEGIYRDGELYEAERKLCCYARTSMLLIRGTTVKHSRRMLKNELFQD